MSTLRQKISVTMAAVMAVSVLGMLPATAEEVAYSFDDYLESYFEKSLPNCLYEYGYSESEDYYVSYPIEYGDYSSDETIGCYVFVFENDNIIGKLRTYTYDDNQYVVFDESVPEEVQTMYDNGEDIAITVDESYTFVVSETDSVALDVKDDVKMDKPVELSASIEKAREVYVSNPDLARSVSLGNYTIKEMASTSRFVQNQVVNGEYVLCWEACLAMKVNYLKGKSLTAMDVYNAVGRPDPHDGNVITDGFICDAYDSYGVTVEHFDKTIPTATLLQELRKNNPIDLSVKDLTRKNLSHAILLYGLYVYDDQTDFYILDPDFTSAYGKATVTTYGTPNTSHENFVYKTTYKRESSYIQHEYKWDETRY